MESRLRQLDEPEEWRMKLLLSLLSMKYHLRSIALFLYQYTLSISRLDGSDRAVTFNVRPGDKVLIKENGSEIFAPQFYYGK